MIIESKQWVYGCLLCYALNLLFENFHNKKVGKNKKGKENFISINGHVDLLP